MSFGRDTPTLSNSLRAWVKEVEAADWMTPAQLKEQFPNASIVRDNRVVFNIRGKPVPVGSLDKLPPPSGLHQVVGDSRRV